MQRSVSGLAPGKLESGEEADVRANVDPMDKSDRILRNCIALNLVWSHFSGAPKCYFAVRLYGTAFGNRFFRVVACMIEDCLSVLQGLARADCPEWRFLHLSALKRIQNPQQPQAASRVPPNGLIR